MSLRQIFESIRRLSQALLQHEAALLLTPAAAAQARAHTPRDVFESLVTPIVDDAEVVDNPGIDARRLS